MGILQIILVCVLILILIKIATMHGTAAGTASFRIFTMTFVLVGIITVIFPELSNILARAIGISRGADLLLYLFVVIFISDKINNYYWRQSVQQRIDKLVRVQALREAQREYKNE